MDEWDAFQTALPGASVRGGETYLPIESALAALDWIDDHNA
jgi:hypothetical protein